MPPKGTCMYLPALSAGRITGGTLCSSLDLLLAICQGPPQPNHRGGGEKKKVKPFISCMFKDLIIPGQRPSIKHPQHGHLIKAPDHHRSTKKRPAAGHGMGWGLARIEHLAPRMTSTANVATSSQALAAALFGHQIEHRRCPCIQRH